MAEQTNDSTILSGYVLNFVTHFFLGGITFLCCHHAYIVGAASYSQHIILCVLGYILLMSQGILVYSDYNGWTQVLYNKNKKILHVSLQVCGAVLAISGSIVRIQAVFNNFSTPHGIFGLLTMILACLTIIGGVVNFFVKSNNRILKICHSCGGIMTVLFAFITLIIGVNKSSFYLTMSQATSSTVTVISVLALFGVVQAALQHIIKRNR